MPVTILPYALTSVEVVKEHIGVPAGNTTYDDLFTRYINAATERIEKWTGRRLRQRSGIVEYQDGLGQNRLLTDEWPAQKPSELWIDGSSAFSDSAKQLDADQYELDLSPRGEGIGVVLVGSGPRIFPRGTRNVKLVYDGGYDPVPADLEDFTCWLVEFQYQTRTDDSINVSTKGKNQENTTFREHLPQIFLDTLNAYTRAEIVSPNRNVRGY